MRSASQRTRPLRRSLNQSSRMHREWQPNWRVSPQTSWPRWLTRSGRNCVRKTYRSIRMCKFKPASANHSFFKVSTLSRMEASQLFSKRRTDCWQLQTDRNCLIRLISCLRWVSFPLKHRRAKWRGLRHWWAWNHQTCRICSSPRFSH